MSVDLKTMTRKQLEKLGSDVDLALGRLKKLELNTARKAAEKVAKSHGFSLSDLLYGDAAPKKKLKKSGPKNAAPGKYADPKDAGNTWTGKGRQPKWFKEAIAAGSSPDAMEI